MTEPWDSFSIILGKGPGREAGTGPAKRGAPRLTIPPLMDIVELPDGICLYCSLPGASLKDIVVTVDKGFLHVRAESFLPPIRGKVHALEFSDILYEGKIRLPAVDFGKLDASLVNGLLRVFIPFPPKNPPVRIPVIRNDRP